ncbi:hypothetical protein [Nafulsella turpanensis]|uniref:hypothetical protein n=1 Tax=Nafulsella turpanensis TaxID=1265690 RepID=UPI000370D9AC|nr:hypothetical protein [Nafulsella turpanensis]
MKQFYLILTAILLANSFAVAQSEGPIRVEAGENVAKAVAFSDQFRFPNFQKGTVFFKNGNTGSSLLNYNHLFDAVQFIDKKGDTLSLANPLDIEQIKIGDKKFFFNNGYYEVIAEFPAVKLTIKQVLEISNREKIGGYGERKNTAAIDNYSSMYMNTQVHELTVNENVILSKNPSFHLLDQNGRLFPATKRNVSRIFPRKHRKEIVQFIKEQNTDFNQEHSIMEVLEFASTL